MLSLNDVCKEYARGSAKFLAVSHVNLRVPRGDFVNIIGRSGSGKSTLMNIAAGMLSPSSGDVELFGEILTGRTDSELSRLRNDRIGFIPQGMSAMNNLTVMENILLPFYLWPHDGDAESYARELLDRLGISGLAGSYPDELSGGELRRVIIARSLINHPDIIIADEPASDLDIESSRNIMNIFTRLNDEGMTIILVTHDLDSLSYGKRVFTMESGVLLEGNHLQA